MIAIFDLDGVITAEQIYWASAGEALGKLLGYPTQSWEIPISLISQIKSLAVNSNWDLAYILLCCDEIGRARARTQTGRPSRLRSATAFDEVELLNTIGEFGSHQGVSLLQQIGAEADRCTYSSDSRYGYRGIEHTRVHRLCQEAHERRLAEGNGQLLEQSTVPMEDLHRVLRQIHAQGIAMGVATGRTRNEANSAMTQFGIERFFEEERVVCYDEVVATEEQLAREGLFLSLAKPHPFSVLRATYPNALTADLMSKCVPAEDDVVYIGDTVSDVLAAKAAGAFSIGVLTGIPEFGTLRETRKKELTFAGCDRVIASILDLPEMFVAFPRKEKVTC